MTQKIEVSLRSMLIAIGLVVGVLVLSQVFEILFTIFISLILVAALDPLVARLERLRMGRAAAILVVYACLIGVLSLLVAAMASPLIDQTKKLSLALLGSVRQIDFLSSHQEEITSQILAQLGSLPEEVFRLTIGIFSNFFSVLTTLAITFYMLVEKRDLGSYLKWLFGSRAGRYGEIVKDLEYSLGGWVRGELVLMLCIGVITYLGLVILGVESALPLAIIAGVLEILPNIGPFISAVPAVLIAATIHPIVAVATAVLYVVVQFFENNFLVPRVMRQAVGVHPVVVILSLMVGNSLAGPTGAVLAIPLFIVGRVLVKEARKGV